MGGECKKGKQSLSLVSFKALGVTSSLEGPSLPATLTLRCFNFCLLLWMPSFPLPTLRAVKDSPLLLCTLTIKQALVQALLS